jgi:hypothetical protein
MTLKLRKLLRSKHSSIDSNWKKKPFIYIFFKGRDGNPSTRSARQMKAGEQMSQKKHNNHTSLIHI